MKYKTEELEKMSIDDIIKVYRDAKTSLKKNILKSLANSEKFEVFMSKLSLLEILEMAKIHPYKEVIVDTMIQDMETHGNQMSKFFNAKGFDKCYFNDFITALQHKSFFEKIKENITKKPALPEALPKKIKQAENLIEILVRRNNATGKKIEQFENQDLGQAVDESRVEVNNGEMAKVFDRYAKEARKEGEFIGKSEVNTTVANRVVAELTEEYMATLGTGKEDVARLVAMKEFESYSGQLFYIPYPRSI